MVGTTNNRNEILSLSLDGFEGPIDLLLSLAREQKIDLTKLSLLELAEQYLLFLNNAIKKDIDIAAEYLVMGAWLAFLKSKILLPDDNNENADTIEDLSELLEFQMKRLDGIQKASKLLFKRHQLGIHFFKRGEQENLKFNTTVNYNLNLYELMKAYGKIMLKNKSETITIVDTKLYSVEKAIIRLKNLINETNEWKNLLDLVPNNIKNKLEFKSAIASHFAACLELVKDGDLYIRQENLKSQIFLSSKKQ